MDPLTLVSMITAAFTVVGPVLKGIVAEAEIIGTDVSAHKSALQTCEDALAGLESVFTTNPLPAPAVKA